MCDLFLINKLKLIYSLDLNLNIFYEFKHIVEKIKLNFYLKLIDYQDARTYK